MGSNTIDEQQVHSFLSTLFKDDLHAKRVLSLALATLGAIHAASLSVYAIGQALGMARGKKGKHGVKQVSRLLSNKGLNVWSLFEAWAPYVLAQKKEVVIALDWTDYDADDHTTLGACRSIAKKRLLHTNCSGAFSSHYSICSRSLRYSDRLLVASVVTRHGRPTPLVWLTMQKSTLKGLRNHAEDQVILRLRELIPKGVKVTLLADRGFADQNLYTLLEEVGFGYVVRFRKIIRVTSQEGESRTAEEWVPKAGQLRLLRGARVTAKGKQVGAVVCVKKKGMKEAWCLATDDAEAAGAQVVGLYRRRFSIEESFRDVKDLRFGMGLSSMRIAEADRRDRLLLVSALACALLTLLGAAGESLGMERYLKANTAKTRTYSLWRQGCMYYQAIPMMPESELRPLMERFAQLVCEQVVFREAFGFV